MSTRSNIGRKNLDGSYDVIYCHSDGYPSYNGRILYEHYQNKEKIDQLIALGALSSLNEEIGERHPFDYGFWSGRVGNIRRALRENVQSVWT